MGVHEIVAQGKVIRFEPVTLPDSRQVRLGRLHPGAVHKKATSQLLIPKPTDDPVAWARAVLDHIIG